MKRETLYHTKYFRTDIWNVIRWCVQLSNKHVIIFAQNELIHHWLDGEDVSIVWKISLSNKTQSFESWLHFKFRKINSKYIRLHTMKRFLGNQIWRSRTIGARMTHNVSVVHHHLILSYLQLYVIQYVGILRLFRNLGKMSWPLVLISYMSYIERCGYINLAVVIIWTFVIYLEGRT